MDYLLQQSLNALQLGSIYALIALGYTMVYGILQMINFAHGDLFMVGAFACFIAASLLGLPFVPALLLAMIGVAALGVVIERAAYRPLRQAPRVSAIITALGVGLFLENLVNAISPYPKQVPPVLPQITWELGGVTFSSLQIVIIAVAAVLMIALDLFVRRTMTGMAMRAVSWDRQTAPLMGIPVDRIISLTFGLGAGLGGAAGLFYSIAYPVIDPYMGVMIGWKAFISAVVGGIGNIRGAMIGGFILGAVEILVAAFLPSTWRDFVAFALLLVLLVFRPYGILRRSGRAVRLGNDSLQLRLVCVGINVILAISLNLVNGYMGEFSIGHAGFMAVGAYAASLLTVRVFPAEAGPALFPIAVIGGGVAAALAGLLIAIPSFRTRGDYLAIVTLAFTMIVKSVLENIEPLGAASGMTGMRKLTTLPWVLAWVVVTVAAIRNLVYSRYGRAILAIREDELAGSLMGIDTRRVKLIAFTVSSFFAGVAGGLLAHFMLFIQPRGFDLIKSTDVLIMVYLGGIGSITGSILGATVYTLLLEWLRPLGAWRMVLMPLLLVLLMIFRPLGLFGLKELPWFVPERDLRALRRRGGGDSGDGRGTHRGRKTA